MAEYVISATLKLKDQLTAKLNAAKSAVSALGKSAVSNTKAATSNIGAATSNIKSATSQLQSATASLGNLKLNLSTGDLARVERLKSTLQNAGNVAAKPINLRANDSVTGKLQKIKSELQSLVNKPWTVNIRENAKNLIGNAKGKISEGLSNGAMAAGATYMGLGAVGGLTVGVVDAFKSQMDFEKQMSAVKAIYSGSFEGDKLNEVTQMLTAAAEHAGATTKFTAKEAADALYYFGMAGWTPDRAAAGLMPTLNLAAAGNASLGTTADIVSDAMTGFHLKAGEYVKDGQGNLVESSRLFADLMGTTITHANTNIEMLGETLKYASSVVGSMYADQSAERKLQGAQDTMLLAGLMANAGVKSSQAGTTIRALFSREGSQNRNAWFAQEKALGVHFSDEQGNVRRIKDIITDLRKAFNEGLSADKLLDFEEFLGKTKIHADTRRKLETLLENAQANGGKLSGADKLKLGAMINGQEGMSGFLAAVMADEGDFNNQVGALDKAFGTVDKMAEIQLDNLAGDLTLMSSAWDAFSRSLVKGEASTGLRNFTQSITDTLSKANELFKDGIDIGDFGEIIIDVIAKLKAKFLELDGIGSILAGGALAFGLKKILALGLSVKDTFSALTKVRSAGDVGNLIRGNQAASNLSAGTVNIRAGVVNVSGAVKGLNGGVNRGVNNFGGNVNRGVNNFGGNVNRLTTTQIAERRAQLSATAAARAQSRSDSALAAAWARPGDAKLLAQYRQADLRAAQLSARASAESARALNLRASEERAAAYYAKRESILQASESKSLQARERIGGVAGAGALAAVFGAMDVAAARSNSTFNLNEAKKQLESEQNQLKILREQGADINQINAQMAAIRAAESNVQSVTEENAINERRAGAGAVGMVAGTAIGAAAGSFVPIIGNMIGGIIGGYLGQWAGEKIADLKTERDAATSSTNSATGETISATGETGAASMSAFHNESENNLTGEEARELVRRQQAAKVAAESETALKKNAVGLNRHAQDNRESQEISALTAADRKRVRAERLDAEIASNVENERARQKQAKFAQEHFSGYNKKLDFTRHFKRRDVMGGTTLGDSNVADWTDQRGAGMQTVDETAADIRKKREDFASGVSKNQAELTAIDENIRAGQTRNSQYTAAFEKNLDKYAAAVAKNLGSMAPFEYKPGDFKKKIPTVGGFRRDDEKTLADFRRENETASATGEIRTNDFTSLSKTGNTETGLEMRGVIQSSTADIKTSATDNAAAETQNAATETQNAATDFQSAASEIQKSAADFQSSTAEISTNSRDEKFVAQSKNGDFTRLSETGNTKTGLESRGVMQKATSETTAAIENLREMAKSFSLEDLIFGKAAANALYEETDAQNFRDLKGYERPEIYPADTGSSINFNIAEEISNAFAAAKSAVATEFTDLATSFSSGFEGVQTSAASFFEGLATSFSSGFESFQNSALTFFTDFATSFSSGFESVQSSALTFFTDLATSFSTGFEGVQSSALTFFTDFATSFSSGFEGVQTSASTFFSDLATSFSSGFEGVQSSALTFFTDLATTLSASFESIQSAASAIFESISATITSSVETAHAAISTAFSSAAAEVQGIWGAIPGFFSGVFGGLGGIAAAAGSAIAAGINSGIGMIQSAWESLSGWLSSKIASISAMAASAAASIGIGANYGGTSSWQGGFTTVNEHGGELIILPNGKTIAPYQTTQEIIAHNYSGSSSFSGGFSTVNEHGGELIIPPRGNAIYPYRTTQNILDEVAHNYGGTSFFSGGWSEFEGGSELMYLPRGTKIIQHAATVSLLRKQIRESLSAQENSNVNNFSADKFGGDSFGVNKIGGDDFGVNKLGGNHFGVNKFGGDSFGVNNSGGNFQSISDNPINSISHASQFDSLGNLIGVDIPEYNRITGDETIAVKRAKQIAQQKLIAHNYGGTSYFGGGLSTVNEHGGELIQLANGATIYPSATVQKILRRQIQTDRLGNIRGLQIPSYNRITGDDSLVVRRAKYQAQLKQYRQERAAISAAKSVTTGENSVPASQSAQGISQAENLATVNQFKNAENLANATNQAENLATINQIKNAENLATVNQFKNAENLATINQISNSANQASAQNKKSHANWWEIVKSVAGGALKLSGNKRGGRWLNVISRVGDLLFKKKTRANQANSESAVSSSASTINQMANQINSASSAGNSTNSINKMANQINSSSINQAANQIGGAQFVSLQPRTNWLESLINIWRQAKNNRSKGGNLLSYEKIWNPIMTLNKQPILGKNPDLPQQLPALSNLLEMGNLPEIPSLDARKLEKNSTSTQSNSTSNTNNNSSATFNFGGVNINNGADFDDFVARIWGLFNQSADNFGG